MWPFVFRVIKGVEKSENNAVEVDFILANDKEIKVPEDALFAFTPEAPFPVLKSKQAEELLACENVQAIAFQDGDIWISTDQAVRHQLGLLAADAIKNLKLDPEILEKIKEETE